MTSSGYRAVVIGSGGDVQVAPGETWTLDVDNDESVTRSIVRLRFSATYAGDQERLLRDIRIEEIQLGREIVMWANGGIAASIFEREDFFRYPQWPQSVLIRVVLRNDGAAPLTFKVWAVLEAST